MRWAAVTAADVLGARWAHASDAEVAQALRVAEAVSEACERILERAVAPRRGATRFPVRGTELLFRAASPDFRWHELLELEEARVWTGTTWAQAPAEPVGSERPYRRLRAPVAHAGEVEVLGLWGMADLREPAGALAGDVTASDEEVGLSGAPPVYPGHTLVIGGERLYVLAADGSRARVLRGQRGTEAVAHSAGAAVEVERYPAAIAAACLIEAVRLLRDGLTGWAASVGPSDLGMQVQPVYPALVDLRRTFHPTGVVAV